MELILDNSDLLVTLLNVVLLTLLVVFKDGKKLLPALLSAVKAVGVKSSDAQLINGVLMQSIDAVKELLSEDDAKKLTTEIKSRAETVKIKETLDTTLEAVRNSELGK